MLPLWSFTGERSKSSVENTGVAEWAVRICSLLMSKNVVDAKSDFRLSCSIFMLLIFQSSSLLCFIKLLSLQKWFDSISFVENHL